MSLRVEYSVTSQREGGRLKRKVYSTKRGAMRRLSMFGPEPWTSIGRDPADLWCCDGSQCYCGGMTVAMKMLDDRATMPKLEFVRLEQREVGEWTACNGGAS